MIIALEGGICSGKTTLAKEFERQGFYLIPEYMDIIHPSEENRINDLVSSNQSAIYYSRNFIIRGVFNKFNRKTQLNSLNATITCNDD